MKRLIRWCAALVLTVAPAVTSAQTAGLATVEFLDVGQGDSILIRSPEGKSALVDAGPLPHVVQLLKDRGIASLDLAVVTHHHADHYGGMTEVVRTFRPRFFLDTDSRHTSAHYLALLERLRESNVRVLQTGPATRKLELGSVVLTFFPQAPEDIHEENNNSVGLRVQYGNISFLLPGDAETAERRWWLGHVPDLCANVTILKLAHHGSRNGTDSAWLDLTKPKLAVASLGHDNPFGHPHPETLSLLAARDIHLLRTDEVGTITIQTDGRTWRLARSHAPIRLPPILDGSPTPRPEARARTMPHGGVVHLNTATEAELRTLPGIGPTLARKIRAGQPYRTVDDLLSVEEMGPKRVEHIRPFVTVE